MKIKDISSLVRKEIKFSKEEELESAYFSLNGHQKKMLVLNFNNVKKIEYILKYNTDYPQFINYFDINEDFKQNIINLIKEEKNKNKNLKNKKFAFVSIYYIYAFLNDFNNKSLEDDLYFYYMYAILRKINAENNTHASFIDMMEIAKNLCHNFSPECLIKNLKEPYFKNDYSECDYNIIRCICTKYNAKYNFSLATKFCHHMNFIIFLDTKYVDLFSMYDKNVKNSLEYYYKYYLGKNISSNIKYKYTRKELNKLKDNNEAVNFLIDIYRNYQTIIDEIISATNISRNGFDHIVWYNSKIN